MNELLQLLGGVILVILGLIFGSLLVGAIGLSIIGLVTFFAIIER